MEIKNYKIKNSIKEGLLDIFFPKKCVGCGKEGEYVCQKCEIFLSEVPNLIEAKPHSSIMSIWEYEGLMEKLIRRIKYDGQYHIIDELVEKAFEKITLELPENTCLTFVPMYKKRERERGFNQAELIAKKVGKMTNREVVSLLTKTKDNVSQVGLDPQGRIENVQDAFQIKAGVAYHKNLLLIDDFWVSGATIKECSRVLRTVGVKNVWTFTLARIV